MIQEEGRDLFGGRLYDYYYDDPDEVITFSSRARDDTYYNGDYTLEHGPTGCEYTGSAEYIDCRVHNYNDSVVDDFWSFTMSDEDPFAHDDPEGVVSVYHRKGKEWYVGHGIEEEEIVIGHNNDDFEYEEEELTALTVSGSTEIVAKVVGTVQSLLLDVEVKGAIYNNLGIGSLYGYNYLDDNDSVFNIDLIGREYEDDMYNVAMEITECVDWDRGGIDDKVIDAYEMWLRSEIDGRGLLFGKYKHLRMLKDIIKREGKELVMSPSYGPESMELYAIKYGSEEYHFRLSELFDTSPERFYAECSKGLTKRTMEREERLSLVLRAEHVFVSVEDSLDSGNCKAGTIAFCRQHNIDTNIIGGVRGDVLLSYDYSNFTRRAVIEALKKQKKERDDNAWVYSCRRQKFGVWRCC